MSHTPGTDDTTWSSVVEWAEHVDADSPHDLRDLEDQLRAQARPGKGVRPLTVIGTIAMIAGITVTWNASDGVTGANGAVHFYDFDRGFELTVLFASFALVCVFQGAVLRHWFANGAVRDTGTLAASLFVGATSALAVSLTLARIDADDAPQSLLLLIPPVVALVAAAAGITVSVAGRRPAGWRPGWNGPATVNLAALSRAEQDALRAQRNRALRILVDRGLLDADPSTLRAWEARPLGRLAHSGRTGA